MMAGREREREEERIGGALDGMKTGGKAVLIGGKGCWSLLVWFEKN